MSLRIAIDVVFLAIVVIAAMLRLNATRRLPWLERAGLALVAAGAIGSGLEYCWPRSMEIWGDFLLHAGAACLALGLMRGDLSALIDRRSATATPLRSPERRALRFLH